MRLILVVFLLFICTGALVHMESNIKDIRDVVIRTQAK